MNQKHLNHRTYFMSQKVVSGWTGKCERHKVISCQSINLRVHCPCTYY